MITTPAKGPIQTLRDALEISQKALACLGIGKNTREFAMSNAEQALAMTADASEDAPGDCRRCRSYATLVKAKESQLAHVQAEAEKGREAIATLASEREANAMLTAELAARPAPVGAVQVPILESPLTCERCNGTGETNGYGVLDCSAPGCTAASERACLNAFIEALPPMTAYDKHWAAYQMGKDSRDEEVQAMAGMVRKMWGHAIELGETDYFNDPQFGKDDWSADCAAAAKLIQRYKS